MTRLLYLPDDVTIIQLDVEIPPKQLTAAINAGLKPVPLLVNSNDKLMASQVGKTVIISPKRKRGHPTKILSQNGLTRRQRQVLELASNGYSNAQIASLMGISRRTVSYHLKGIKTQIHLSTDAVIAEEPAFYKLSRKEE